MSCSSVNMSLFKPSAQMAYVQSRVQKPLQSQQAVASNNESTTSPVASSQLQLTLPSNSKLVNFIQPNVMGKQQGANALPRSTDTAKRLDIMA
jgi:hypothetical protein